MPFEIVRNDIVNMDVDAIVNTANPQPLIGAGCDAGIHQAAGPQLLQARQKIGALEVGQVAVTPGFSLKAKYVLHAVSPLWQGGGQQEEQLLRQCYDLALQRALENNCTSIAFPLLAAGNYGFPPATALQIAISAFSAFLLEHDMQIYLVVFNKAVFGLSEKLFSSVQSYIDENYILDKSLQEYGLPSPAEKERRLFKLSPHQSRRYEQEQSAAAMMAMSAAAPGQPESAPAANLQDLLSATDAGFSETLLTLIDRTGKKDSVIYKKANVDRKLFSKIRNNPAYQPKKATAVAFALALELNLEETKTLIGRAGYALTHSSKFDIIVEYFIKQQNYNVMELNEVLFAFDQPLIGA